MMLAMHGGLYLAIKTENPIRDACHTLCASRGYFTILFFAVGGLWVAEISGYVIMSGVDPSGYSNPLHKTVAFKLGAWLQIIRFIPT